MIDVSKLEMTGPFVVHPLAGMGRTPASDEVLKPGEKEILEILDPEVKKLMEAILLHVSIGRDNDERERVIIREVVTVPVLNQLRAMATSIPRMWANYLDDRVICDEVNNSPNIIDQHMLAWDLYIKISNSTFVTWAIQPINNPDY